MFLFEALLEVNDGKARIILFEVEKDTGLKSVQDIVESDFAWFAARMILTECDGQPIIIGEKTFTYPFKTERTRIAYFLSDLEAQFKTGLNLAKPIVRKEKRHEPASAETD